MISLSQIRTLDLVTIWYMKVIDNMKHRQITKTMMGELNTRNATQQQGEFDTMHYKGCVGG